MAERVCPVWVGYLLANPLRKLFQNPDKILNRYIKKGMKVLDIGCAMGFFSLPLAKMVGSGGKVVCVDLQEKMIKSLKKRAKKANLSNIIETRVCSSNSLGINDLKEIDFVLAFAVVHEVPDVHGFFSEVYKTLKPDTGRFLIIEPKGHVTKKDFETTIFIAEQNSFKMVDNPGVARSHAALLKNIGH